MVHREEALKIEIMAMAIRETPDACQAYGFPKAAGTVLVVMEMIRISYRTAFEIDPRLANVTGESGYRQ